MSPKNRWGLYWLGIVTAGTGGAALMFQIDNASIGAPQSGAGWTLGLVMVTGGAWLFGWARKDMEPEQPPSEGTITQPTLSERIAEATPPSHPAANRAIRAALLHTDPAVVHCWTDLDNGATCMLIEGHDGPHKPTADTEIIVIHNKETGGIEVSLPPGATTP